MTDQAISAPAAPAAAPNPAPAGNEPAPQVQQVATYDWNAAGLDAEDLNTVQTKGWTNPKDMVGSYKNLEKLMGAPPDQIIKLPKDMSFETMGEVFDKLGRPKTAAEYKLPVPDGDDGAFAGEASKWFHEAGLSAAQGGKLAETWNKYVAASGEKQMADYTKSVEMDTLKLKTEWGDKHDANLAVARQAATTFGLDADTIAGLEKTLGFAGTHRLMFSIGSKIGESEFIQGGGKPGEFQHTSVESARAQIAELKASKTFAARFSSSDPTIRGEAQAQMRRLEQIANPGTV